MPSSPLPPVRRYLWAQGPSGFSLPVDTLLAGRYRVIQYPLIEDSHPDEPPVPLESVPLLAEPYLALSRFSVAIPRPFTQVLHPESSTSLLLLEEIPLAASADGSEVPSLLPTLREVWAQSTALHQLTWLWRLAKLWQACIDNRVAGTLLDWQNIRVDDEDIRLVSLLPQAPPPSLKDLGEQWRSLAATAASPIRDYLVQLTDLLVAGKGSADSLIYSLVRAMEELSPQQAVTVQIATYSDQGPTRQRNEDACHPENGFVGQTTIKAATADTAVAPLVVVCDGVGGHQGGDVASHVAIAEVTRRLSNITTTPNAPHRTVVAALKRAILAANQIIADRNNADQREDRNRMGTTIVIALVYGTRLYVAHLGDSRAYRVRSHSCRQLTLDDDVAAREMRLGLELYQDALQNPGAGALIQALGMADSSHLRPTVKLFPIATDSLYVLCSDGLSDNDLLDHLWQSELKPVLQGDRDVATAGQRLIDLANTHNGHDNVTVALLRLLPERADQTSHVPIQTANLLLSPPPPTKTATASSPMPANSSTAMALAPDATATKRWRPFPVLVSSVVVAALVGGLGAISWQWFSQRPGAIAPADSETSGEILSPSATPPRSAADDPDANVAVGNYLQIRQLADPTAAATMLDTENPPVPKPSAAVDIPERLLSVGSIVQVMGRQKTPDDQLWVRLEVCSVAVAETEAEALSAASGSPQINESADGESDRPIPLAQPGDQGWLLETDLPVFSEQILDTSNLQTGSCTD